MAAVFSPSKIKETPWQKVTWRLTFAVSLLCLGSFMFGYDAGSFGGILAGPSFRKTFASNFDEATGTYEISQTKTSLMASLAFIGKFIGTIIAAPLIERVGHRWATVFCCVISIFGVILEISSGGSGAFSGRAAQFIVGRLLVYVMIGTIECVVPTYQAEVTPGPLRGLVTYSLQTFVGIGVLVANVVTREFRSWDTGAAGWQIPTGIQFIFPVLIMMGLPFIPDSPRWLISRHRNEDAVAAMKRVRPKTDADAGLCDEEVATIREALENKVEKGPWLDLFRKGNFNRTQIVVVYWVYQQITGQAFVGSFQQVFYRNFGFAEHAFTYPVISSALSVLAAFLCQGIVDKLGRRTMIFISCGMQCLWLYLMAGLGLHLDELSQNGRNFVVACIMLYSISYNFAGGGIAYILGAEVPTAALREKTIGLGAAVNVLFAILINYIVPLMLERIGYNLGWVFGSVALSCCFYTFFILPETKGLVLEETDALFATRFNPFKSTRAQLREGPAARRLHELEAGGHYMHDKPNASDDKLEDERLEESGDGHGQK